MGNYMRKIKDSFANLYYFYLCRKKDFELVKFQRRWRNINQHNFTRAGNIFPVEKVKVREYTYGTLHVFTYGNPNEALSIGRYCSIAGTTRFVLSGEHNYKLLSTYPFRRCLLEGQFEALCKGPIIIEDDVWVGEQCTILSGVSIGKGAVIGAGSVVTKDVPPYAIVAGIPAKVIKYRFPQPIIDRLLQIDLGKLGIDAIRNHSQSLYGEIQTIDQLEALIKELSL